jgi:hypothetical protein
MGIRLRSDDLDRLLDRVIAGEDLDPLDDLAPLLHPARVARAAMATTVAPAVASAHISALHRGETVRPVPDRRRRRVRRLTAIALVGVLFVMGAGSAVAASSGALPGDRLYGVKRAVERVSLSFHRKASSRATFELGLAQKRIDEITAAVAAGKDPSAAVSGLEDALDGAQRDALRAVALGTSGDALLAHVQAMIAKHVLVLQSVLDRVPAQAHDAILRAIANAGKASDKIQHGRDAHQPQGPPATPPGQSGNPPGRSDHAPGLTGNQGNATGNGSGSN